MGGETAGSAPRRGRVERRERKKREIEVGTDEGREKWEEAPMPGYPFRLGSGGISQEFLACGILRGGGGPAVISYSLRRGMVCTAIYFIMSLSLMALALTRF